MLPVFPRFKPLELSDRKAVEKITDKFPPYSDFNFTSLWCWNTDGQVQLSRLHGNLVVILSDYLTSQPLFSFIGSDRPSETAGRLLDFISSSRKPLVLKLVPEFIATALDARQFTVEPDQDNFDYVLSVESLRTFRGNKLGPKRNFVNRFMRLYAADARLIDITARHNLPDMGAVFDAWAKEKLLAPKEYNREKSALLRLVDVCTGVTSIVSVGLFVSGRLVAFSVNELLGRGYSLLHFEKACSSSYIGIFPYLMRETGRVLHDRGCEHLNFEQDLGIGGLRHSKTHYHPTHFFKKFTIRPASSR